LPIQRYFTCVLALHRFSCNVEKNPLMAANKLRYSPFSYQMLTMQATAAIHAGCVQIHRISAKKEQIHVRQTNFFFL
jgi:hypothetical protein